MKFFIPSFFSSALGLGLCHKQLSISATCPGVMAVRMRKVLAIEHSRSQSLRSVRSAVEF